MKILVADDSPVVATMLATTLAREGYQTVRAADGIEATQRAYSEMPDLILLDIFMPRMNGYQVCRLLKNDPVVAEIPVIILTGSDSTSAEFWSMQTGANAFMTKGFEHDELLATVRRLIPNGESASRRPPAEPPSPEEILSRVSLLMDRELYASTVERIQLQTVLQNLSDGIVTLDLQRRFVSANAALCGMVGAERDELLGRPAAEVIGGGAVPAAIELFEQALAGNSVTPRDAELANRNGVCLPVEVSAALLRDYNGEVVGCVCLFKDITRRKQVEALYDQLRTLDQVKEDLTHMIVHDLRTPLTALIGGLQTIEMLGDLNSEQRDFLGLSVDSGQTLLGMISDLLDISKMEEGSIQLDYGKVHVSELADRALQQIATLAKNKGTAIETRLERDLPLVPADEEKLRRILVNLLGNAVKFTPRHGTVTLIAERHDGNLLFRVCDSGEGIPKDAFDRIFEKFEQVESRKAGRKMSSGLGLTFCKMAVEAHGGRIWVESQVGRGSTFSFTIPLARP
jgi:PAS domain S-box-containing protein